MDFHGLNRKKLQELCKKHGIPANLKNVEMANRLSSLLLKEEVPEKAAVKRGRSCLKNVSEDVEVVECEKVDLGSKEVKKVRFSPENQTFLFERTDPRAVRLLARKKRAFVNSRKKQDPVVVSVNFEESERLGVVSDNVGRVAEPVGKRNLRRKSVVISEDVGLDLAVKGGNLGRSLRSRRGEMITETHESVETMSKEENVVKGRNLRRSSRRSLVEAKVLGLESETVDDMEKLPTKQDNVEVISLLSPCGGDDVNKPVEGRNPKRSLRSRGGIEKENVGGASFLSPCVEKKAKRSAKGKGIAEEGGDKEVDRPQNEMVKGKNLRSSRRSLVEAKVLGLESETVDAVEKLPTKKDNVEVVSLLSPSGGVNVSKPVEVRNPKTTLRSRGGIEKENGVGGASLLSPCVEKKAKRGAKGKGIAEEGGGKEADKPQNEMVNHGGNIGRVTRKQLRHVDVVAVSSGRDDDSVAEVLGLNNVKNRGRPRKSVRLAEHSHEMITEPLENKGIKRGRRKTLMVKQPDINGGRDVVVEKLGEGNNMDGNESRESAKKSRKDSSVEEVGDIRRSSRRAGKTKADIPASHQTMNHGDRKDDMIADDSPIPVQLESRNPEVNEQYEATGEVNVQIAITDETTSLLKNNGDDVANKGHESPDLVVATEEVDVQTPINVGGDGTWEIAKTSRRNDKNGSVKGLDYIRRSGRRAAKNTVDIPWSRQTMHHVEHMDHMIEDDSQMAAQIGSRSPEVNEQYQATEAVDVQMPVNDDSTPALLRNRDDDEANMARHCPELVVATDYDSEDKNASFCSITAQICDAIEANHSGDGLTTGLSHELESGKVASETLESSLVLETEKSPSPSKKDETDFQDVNETDHIASNDVIPGDSTPAGNASDYRNPNTEDAIEANHSGEENTTSSSNELESDMLASGTLESNVILQLYGPSNEEKWHEKSPCPSKKDETDFQDVNEKSYALETDRIAGYDIVAGDSTPAGNASDYRNPNTEGQTRENKSSVPKEQKVENLAQHKFAGRGMQLEVCKNTEINSQDVGCSSDHATSSLVPNDFNNSSNQAQEIPFRLKGAFDGSLEDENASVARNAVEGTIDDTSFSSMAAENCEGTSEPICSSAIQPTLPRSRESISVHEDTNIMRNCEDFESNGVPELHDYEVNEQRENEEEFEELSCPCKDNVIGSELLQDSAIFIDNLDVHDYEVNEQRKEEEEPEESSSPYKDNAIGSELLEDSAIVVDNLDVQLTEPSKVCGTTGACKSIFVHELPSSSRSDTDIVRNSEEFESNGVPELHDNEMNDQSREDEGFEELSTPCKDISMGSELFQLAEQSIVSGSTGACNSICVHDEQPSNTRSDSNMMKCSKDFESNRVPELHDYEMIKQGTEDEVFEELSAPCKDNSVGSVLLEVPAIADKLDVQLTEQSKYSGSTGACNSICLPEKQPSNSLSDINIMKNSEGFESNGVTELHDYETNEQAEDEGFEDLSSPCKDDAKESELLGVSAAIVDKCDVQLTEQSKVSGSTGASDSTFKEADQTISETSATQVERREERCNDTSGGKFLCSANVCKTGYFVEIEKTTLEQSEQVKKSPEPDIQPFILKDDFINSTDTSGFTAASLSSESMQLNMDEHYGASRRDNFSVEQKPERVSDAVAFSPSSSEQLPVTHNIMQVEDYSKGESGLQKARENAEQYVQTLANAAAGAVPSYQSTGHVGADYTFLEDEFTPRSCNSKEGASLRSIEAQYDNSTSEQQELADNSKDFEYCLQHLFSEADILDTNEIKGVRSITDDDDDDDQDLKETCSVSQLTMFKVDSSLSGQVADDIESPSTDDMDMDDEDLKEAHSVSQVTGSKTDSSLRKQVANDIERPSTDDMDVDNNHKSVLPLNEDSETKICSMGKSNTILAASVSTELLKEENIEEATQIPTSTLPLYMRLSEECDEEKESEMNSPTFTNLGGSNSSLIHMTDRCTEDQEEHVSTPPIIDQGTSNENFGSNVGLAKSPVNENEIGYNMSGSNVGLTEQEGAGRSRRKSDIISKESDDGEWPTEFISDEKLEVGGEASVKGRVRSPSVMEESTPKVSPATLRKLMEDAKDVVTVTHSRLQDGVSDGRSKKRKSESDISVQTSSSYLKTRVTGEPTVFSGSMEKDEESCKESKVGDIACSGNSRKVDYLKFIQMSPNEDANNLVFENDLMTFDNEKNLDADKTSRITEGDDGHYLFSKDKKLNESPTEDANNFALKDDLMNFDKERDMESDKTPRVIEDNDDGHYISSQDKKLNESPNQDANNLVFEDDLMNVDKERNLESDKTLRVIEGKDEGHDVFSQDKKLYESASEDANNLVFEDDLMNFDNERDLESDKTSRVTEGNDEEHHVFSQGNKSNESANEAANNLVFEDALMNFDKERDLESDKTLRVAEGNDEGEHVSPQDKKSNECAKEHANNLVFEDDLMNFDKERGLESDKISRVTEGNDGGHYVSSLDKKSNELQFHHCSHSSSADLSSFIMGLMGKDMSENFQAEESSPFLSQDETDHKLDNLLANQFPHESDSKPHQEGNIVMFEAEELDALNSAMNMHQETTSEASFNPTDTDDSITDQNQLKFSTRKDAHVNCVVDVTEINGDDDLVKGGLYPLGDSEKKTGEMDMLFEVAPEVKSLPSSNLLREREDSDHLKECNQVEMEIYMDTAALEDGRGGKLCAEAGSYITGSMMAQQNDLEEQIDYHTDPVQDDACEIATSQLASKCLENSESLPHDIHETSGFDDDTRHEKSFNSEACMQLKEEEGIHVNFTAEDASEGMENSPTSPSFEGRDGMESALPQINQGESTNLDAQRDSELDAADDKMMLKRRNRSVLIHGTPRKPLLPTIDMKENMAAPKRMQMVNATATKPGVKRKALGDIWK